MEPSISLFLRYKTINKVTKYIHGQLLNIRQSKSNNNYKIWISLITLYLIASILIIYMIFESQKQQLSNTLIINQECESDVASENCYDFRIFSCGIYGGAYQGLLTSFLLSQQSDPTNFLSMDGGTSLSCINYANNNLQLDIILDFDGYQSSLNTLDKIGYFRNFQMNGFLISHVHLDHIGGMIISSAEDLSALSGNKKPVISRPIVINQLYNEIWRDLIWPSPSIFNYYGVNINENDTTFTDLRNVTFNQFNYKIKTFPLMHTVASTGFFICNIDETSCIVFLGDTGPDPIEESNDLRKLWRYVAPYIVNGKLTTIFMESSYVSSRSNSMLFGHLSMFCSYSLFIFKKSI